MRHPYLSSHSCSLCCVLLLFSTTVKCYRSLSLSAPAVECLRRCYFSSMSSSALVLFLFRATTVSVGTQVISFSKCLFLYLRLPVPNSIFTQVVRLRLIDSFLSSYSPDQRSAGGSVFQQDSYSSHKHHFFQAPLFMLCLYCPPIEVSSL